MSIWRKCWRFRTEDERCDPLRPRGSTRGNGFLAYHFTIRVFIYSILTYLHHVLFYKLFDAHQIFFSIQFNWINICLLIPHPFNIDLSYITSSLLNEWRISIRSRESLILGFEVPPLRLPSDLPAPEALRNICKRLRRRELCGISYGASLCMPLSATLCSKGEVTTRPTSVSLHSVLASPCSFSSRIKSRRFWKPPISHIIH